MPIIRRTIAIQIGLTFLLFEMSLFAFGVLLGLAFQDSTYDYRYFQLLSGLASCASGWLLSGRFGGLTRFEVAFMIFIVLVGFVVGGRSTYLPFA